MQIVNRWAEAEHALAYLASRDRIPHRVEGLGVLVEVVGTGARRVLDLGTGAGDALALVLAASPDASGVGLDFQAAMLERARERFAGNERVTIVEHDLDQPLPALDSFDLIVSSFAIHHLAPTRQQALYREVFSLLRPGGRFANLEHVASATPVLHLEFLAALGTDPANEDPSNQCVGLTDHLEWLAQAGFVDVDCMWKWRELALVTGVRAS
jgi:tRNA (cmo5U34)-methyltransferase